jgi:hypothetical protein
MLTRRSFLGTLAALAASRVAPVPAACDCHLHERQVCDICQGVGGLDRVPRRDDGDTLLELR